MRTRLICPQCAKNNGGIGVWFREIIREDGLYTGKCPKGHDLHLGTQTLPHEMLFEIALNAIEDGYYREAISSFAASAERFFEFAVRVLASAHAVSENTFALGWKRVSIQSERQLGAYIFLHMIAFGEVPKLFADNMTKLRNDVIHKGKLPEKSDAIAFGDAAYETIQDSVGKLRLKYLDHVNKVLGEHVTKIAEKMGDRYPRTFQVTPTALNIVEDTSAGFKSFHQILLEHGISIAT